MSSHRVMEIGSKIAIHLLAVVAGVALILIGLLFSVPIVGLILGIPIGLAGVLLGLWGLFGVEGRKAVVPRSTGS